MQNLKKLSLFLILAAFMVIAAACGGNDESNADGNEDTGNDNAAAELEGSVEIDGSGTVYPFMSLMAENYMGENEGVSVEVGRSGTSAGFEKFLAEDSTKSFNDASRPMKDEEKTKAEELGIDVQELKVALDGLTFVINPENDWADELTADQIKNIFLADGNIKQWSDLNPEWPAEDIVPMGPNENHGTYEFFVETILDEQELTDTVKQNLQQEYSVLVENVAKDKNAIAFFGFGYYDSNKDKLTAVKVDFGDGTFVEPSTDTIGESEDFPYSEFTRPVFTYLNTGIAKEQPQVLDYAIYTMENANTVAAETGFAPLPEDEIKASLDALNALK